MQSRPTETSKQSSFSEASQNTNPRSQDGVHHDHFQLSHSPRDSSEHASGQLSRPEVGPPPQQSELQGVGPLNSSAERLSHGIKSSPTGSVSVAGDTRKKSLEIDPEALELRLDPPYELPTRQNISVEDFPNEVLVQVLTHLPPNTLSTITLVSRRFYELVTTPHAWRIAFGRYFPGPDAIPTRRAKDREDGITSSRREFTRLTAFATWRSEYTLRPKLLKALERGKPSHILAPAATTRNSRISSTQNTAQLTYSSRLLSVVDRLHCNFQAGPNKHSPRAVHGSHEMGKASMSDPMNGKVEYWGSGDPQIFAHFDDVHPTDIPYGLGPGATVGLPNSMDVSQMHGMVVGEGTPGGDLYYRSTQEQRGRLLANSRGEGVLETGIPRLDPSRETVCSVWIAKSTSIPSMTGGMIGLLSGSSYGVLSAYSTGSIDGSRGFAKGEVTARWVLSPAVPIIAIAVDENYNMQRLSKRRTWAMVLNALGEVFYITDLPKLSETSTKGNLSEPERYERAWRTGRSVFWSFVEPTRRIPKNELSADENIHATYSPRSSWEGMSLSKTQVAAETSEIEQYIRKTPMQIRELCDGWDMRRRFEADFAGDDENDAGEAFFIISCGIESGDKTAIRRFKRLKVENTRPSPVSSNGVSPSGSPKPQVASIFGGESPTRNLQDDWSFAKLSPDVSDIPEERPRGATTEMIDLWRESKFALGGLKDPTITCSAIDLSAYALTTTFEDPRLSMTASNASSPQSTPSTAAPIYTKPADIPGQRARFLAIGTSLGSILIWNVRTSANTSKPVRPLRVISTADLREISSLAVTSLYVVHGDTEGVVQAWDPLASTTQPVRTLHSRFSSRHRRQLNEMHGIPQGMNVNLFGANAIALDPDPTVLRGVVSLGTHLHYWSYSTSDVAKYKPGKRRLRRSPRGSNQTPDRMGRLGRDKIKDYISKEQAELAHDEKARLKEHKRIAGRFGTELLGPDATDAEIMAYATMLSQEAAINDQAKAFSESASSDAGTEILSSPPSAASALDGADDPDLAAAMLLSLQDSDAAEPAPESLDSSLGFDIPLRYARKRNTKSPSTSPPSTLAGRSKQPEVDDLEFALQLSRAEAQSLNDWQEEFPSLERKSSDETEGKGKGKGRRRS